MGVTRTSGLVQQPCYGLFKQDGTWYQVKCVRWIQESGKLKNLIQLPDGTEKEVSSGLVVFDDRRKCVVHPDAP